MFCLTAEAQGVELAGSLRKNKTVKSVNLECGAETFSAMPDPGWGDHGDGEIIRYLWGYNLVGGLEHFLFSHILGIIIPID